MFPHFSQYKRATSRDEGFSLIELMIVMSIINIMASVAVPNYLRARDKGYFGACKAQLVELRFAMNEYHEDHDAYGNSGLAPYMFNEDTATDAQLEAAIRRVCAVDWSVNNIVAYSSSYVITGNARDRHHCLIQVTPGSVTPSSYFECIP